jgi:2-oxoglutarate dehydrogenase E2 component (dihydrolipoamide succinyltransferase)
MSIEVKIPAVGESIESGVVSVWHKKSGEYVNAGEALLTLETDKVSTEITAEIAGLLETKAEEGQEVKIGEVVALIDDKATAPNEIAPAAKVAGKRSSNADVLSPAVKRMTTEEKVDPAKISGTGKGGRLTKGDVIAHLQTKPEASTDDQEKPRLPKELASEPPSPGKNGARRQRRRDGRWKPGGK